ncbi:uncharacterized protein LOC132687497 [Panthera onca]
MVPMQKKAEKEGGKKKEMIMVEVKKEIIEKYERATKVVKERLSGDERCWGLQESLEAEALFFVQGLTRGVRQSRFNSASCAVLRVDLWWRNDYDGSAGVMF